MRLHPVKSSCQVLCRSQFIRSYISTERVWINAFQFWNYFFLVCICWFLGSHYFNPISRIKHDDHVSRIRAFIHFKILNSSVGIELSRGCQRPGGPRCRISVPFFLREMRSFTWNISMWKRLVRSGPFWGYNIGAVLWKCVLLKLYCVIKSLFLLPAFVAPLL